MKKASPTNDLMFKKTFGSIGNEDIVEGLAADFYMVLSGKIIVTNPYSIDAYAELGENEEETTMLRETLTDIALRAEIESLTMEMQIRKTDYFDRRTLYYACDKYRSGYNAQREQQSEEPENGEKEKTNRYKSLRPLYSLNILGYDYFTGDDAFRRFDLYDLEHAAKYVDKVTGKDLFAISFFEYNKPNVKNANHRYWQMYFQGLSIPKEAPNYIKKAERLLDFVNLSEKERKMYAECEKRKADMDAYLSTARNEGEARGIMLGEARGRSSERVRIAYALMKELGLPLSSVLTVMPDATESELIEIRAMSEKN
jgi:hypothetical protein